MADVRNPEKTLTGYRISSCMTLIAVFIVYHNGLDHYFVIQISPLRILLLNQPQLPLSSPFFALLFSRYCAFSAVMYFVEHQSLNPILLSESFDHMMFVLPDPLDQIGSNSSV
jgi:hypothetical protein